MDALLTFIVAVVVLGYGTATSWLQERFGRYDDIASPGVKQLVNAIINLVVPYIAIVVQPYWKPEFGDITQIVTVVAVYTVPLLIWAVSQLAHHLDPARFVAGSFKAKKEKVVRAVAQ